MNGIAFGFILIGLAALGGLALLWDSMRKREK
jgi:hypothetical protein